MTNNTDSQLQPRNWPQNPEMVAAFDELVAAVGYNDALLVSASQALPTKFQAALELTMGTQEPYAVSSAEGIFNAIMKE